jgi:nitric oxide reductase NorD protein
MSFFEPEEWVGRHWHRFVGGSNAATYPHHKAAAVTLNSVKGVLGIFYRGLGGSGGVKLAAGGATTSGHRLSLRQKLGMEAEKLDRAAFDGDSLLLPQKIDLFADPALNRDLYFWLAAYFAHTPCLEAPPPADPLQADIAFLKRTETAIAATLAAHPGFKHRYRRLCQALRDIRPKRRLPPAESAVEEAVTAMLDGQPLPALDLASSPRYRPFLPVPLWGEIRQRPGTAQRGHADNPEEEEGGEAGDSDQIHRRAKRRDMDQAERDDSLILNNMENILGLAEAINVNRAVDDDDEDSARKAADELDEITLTTNKRRAATRLRFDLDLPPNQFDASPLKGRHVYPEWDFRAGSYRRDHCVVLTGPASEEGEAWQPDDKAQTRIRRIRRQFEALRPKREILRRQMDGFDLDMDALVRSRTDLMATGVGANAIYLDARNHSRDLTVALLVDVSLSTDAWIEGRRVLDIEKEALLVLAMGLNASGDNHAIYTFTSRRRDFVRIETVKAFDEQLGPTVHKRIGALKPGYYTRMGTALRHVTREINQRPNRHRLILLLTDGKPNDIDHYEGRYAVEDSRKAVQEARRSGAAVFGVTVDVEARDYFPHLFGRGGYHIVGHAAKLSAALPKIYRQLTG